MKPDNQYIEDKKREFRTQKRNAKIIRRLGVLSPQKTIKTSCTNQGQNNT